MDKAALRLLTLEALRRTPQTHIHAIESEIRQKVPGYERADALLVQEVVWDLLVQGILAPGKNSLNLHLPFVHVTEYGQRCLDEDADAAYDADGYIARLRSENGGRISESVLEAARDALSAFHRGLFRASLVLLSRAAADVLEEIGRTVSPKGAARFALFSPHGPDVLMAAAGAAPCSPSEDLERALSELLALAQLAHSTSGAPRAPVTDRESTLGRLLLFPAQCRLAYTLAAAPRP